MNNFDPATSRAVAAEAEDTAVEFAAGVTEADAAVTGLGVLAVVAGSGAGVGLASEAGALAAGPEACDGAGAAPTIVIGELDLDFCETAAGLSNRNGRRVAAIFT
jgi:hypothetical protein